jgi:ferredoxin
MADRNARLSDNVPGRFYVDDQCIDCDVCREVAPGVFRQNREEGHSFVFAQPDSRGEEAAAREALEECPVEAIGDDG